MIYSKCLYLQGKERYRFCFFVDLGKDKNETFEEKCSEIFEPSWFYFRRNNLDFGNLLYVILNFDEILPVNP